MQRVPPCLGDGVLIVLRSLRLLGAGGIFHTLTQLLVTHGSYPLVVTGLGCSLLTPFLPSLLPLFRALYSAMDSLYVVYSPLTFDHTS